MTEPHSEASISRLPVNPRIITRSEHCISRANISEAALKVLYRLKNTGFKAFLVGGGVRDLLLGREPKDFDIATDALPEQIRELFRNCRLIGRRFRLAHIRFGREIIEVATFRTHHDAESGDDGVVEHGRILRDNVYGAIDDDVWRRDFTINSLYYDIEDFSVIDYTGGVEDVKAGRLRLIGDPEARYREDPVRMLRAVRFAVKLGFSIHDESEKAIFKLGYLLEDIPPARLFDEILKLFMAGSALQTFEQLRHYGLFGILFPDVEQSLSEQEGGFPHMLLINALKNTDARITEGKPVTPAFLFAALLWDPMRCLADQHRASSIVETEAMQLAMDTVISRQVARVGVPRRFTQVTREIWAMQSRLTRRGGKRAERLAASPRFRAAYDFLLLRVEAGEPLEELANWWTEYQESSPGQRPTTDERISRPGPKRRRRRRKKKVDPGD